MKILLTGGSGFIGKNIRESFLARKYTILAPGHRELDLLDQNAVRDYLEHNRVDYVVHGAVRPGHRNAEDPSRQLDNNVRMFFSLARNSRLFKKMLYLGSGLVYDFRYYEPKMKEEYFDTHIPVDEGGFSKYIITKYIEKSENILELRIFGIFGKYEDYAIRFISNMICKALHDLPLTMKQNRRFDYIYIDDLYPVLDYFMNHDAKQRIYNITPDRSVELYALARMVLEVSGKELPIHVATEGMGLEYSGDNGRLKEEYTDLQFIDQHDAIKDLYGWYSANVRMINREKLLADK